MKENGIHVVVEHFEGRVRPVSHELIAFAKTLGKIVRAPVRAIVVGDEPGAAAREIAVKTGLAVAAARAPGHGAYNGEVYTRVVEKMAEKEKPLYICVAHTSTGLDFAPGLAIRLKAACITGVNGIAPDGARGALFSRAVYNGKFNAFVRPRTVPVVVTVQPGFFQPLKYTGAPGVLTTENMGRAPSRIRNKGVKKTGADENDLAGAKIVIAAGRGVGERENLARIFRFSRLFASAVVAGSRPMIDMGWMPHWRQVGVTGASISPDIYIACGISGSSQHIAGMNGSGCVIAVNNDK
ncbi:MAG: electron transfer flavoprotein subunit alpha/FixB family protein, partial [Desulfobacterales bacterium]|nr:electron transfer flavoprotein subunit alpha/FixB family protein [Desulfobacterales bacterium]